MGYCRLCKRRVRSSVRLQPMCVLHLVHLALLLVIIPHRSRHLDWAYQIHIPRRSPPFLCHHPRLRLHHRLLPHLHHRRLLHLLRQDLPLSHHLYPRSIPVYHPELVLCLAWRVFWLASSSRHRVVHLRAIPNDRHRPTHPLHHLCLLPSLAEHRSLPSHHYFTAPTTHVKMFP